MRADSYSFICGYCEAILDTPYNDDKRAHAYAQRHGWRYTYGPSPRWGDGANVTCPNCQTPEEEKISMALRR